ncbi:hypothetical protein QFW77_08110 [Luteimonas sp. RD2P54]|uniref:Uncharacterized protein n=1 Tax=Luteimonas endophytica TaxID=3042023 RepID=A0ABT6J809_9GAMM|nr:hypothetical protein [Luteimonas endophytica]MDH5822951.1 hypothetical protein [Luteimonas endophytica]
MSAATMRPTDTRTGPAQPRRRLAHRRGAAAALLLAAAVVAGYLAATPGACGPRAGGLVIHDARGQPRLAIGLTGRCLDAPRKP